jgi:hypothetical protein
MSLASILLLAAAASAPPICTDRPAKANAVCTVPTGKWQLETAAVDWLQFERSGSETETLLFGSSLLKYGISSQSDLQLGFTPYVRVSTDGDHQSGFGDVTLRFKQRLTGANSPVQVGLIPFVKLPTARLASEMAKRKGGLALPSASNRRACDGDVRPRGGPVGRHRRAWPPFGHRPTGQFVGNCCVADYVGGEFWANWNFDPAGTIKQVSADAALAYALSDALQLDAGVNAGLTGDTADVELSAGFSAKRSRVSSFHPDLPLGTRFPLVASDGKGRGRISIVLAPTAFLDTDQPPPSRITKSALFASFGDQTFWRAR